MGLQKPLLVIHILFQIQYNNIINYNTNNERFLSIHLCYITFILSVTIIQNNIPTYFTRELRRINKHGEPVHYHGNAKETFFRPFSLLSAERKNISENRTTTADVISCLTSDRNTIKPSKKINKKSKQEF